MFWRKKRIDGQTTIEDVSKQVTLALIMANSIPECAYFWCLSYPKAAHQHTPWVEFYGGKTALAWSEFRRG